MPPTQPPGPAAAAAGKPSRPAVGNAAAASLIAGEAVAQDCGTDNLPTEAAWPRPPPPRRSPPPCRTPPRPPPPRRLPPPQRPPPPPAPPTQQPHARLACLR